MCPPGQFVQATLDSQIPELRRKSHGRSWRTVRQMRVANPSPNPSREKLQEQAKKCARILSYDLWVAWTRDLLIPRSFSKF